jgi:hypothetical protein
MKDKRRAVVSGEKLRQATDQISILIQLKVIHKNEGRLGSGLQDMRAFPIRPLNILVQAIALAFLRQLCVLSVH